MGRTRLMVPVPLFSWGSFRVFAWWRGRRFNGSFTRENGAYGAVIDKVDKALATVGLRYVTGHMAHNSYIM